MKKTLLALTLCAASLAHAGPRGWIDFYQEQSMKKIELCQLTYSVAWSEASYYEKGNECVASGKEQIKSWYSQALGQVSKGAREPFKNHLIKTLAALESSRPSESETRGAYSARTSRIQEGLNEAWVRFDLEQQ